MLRKSLKSVLIALVKVLPPLPMWLRRWCERHLYDRYFADPSPERARRRWFRGVYATWEEATRSVPAGWKPGCDTAEQRRVAALDYRSMYPRDYPVLFWLSTLLTEGVRVFDWGGSVGITYYTFQKYLSYPQKMTWTVCDQPGVVEVGRELAMRQPSTGLSFTSEFQGADGADVLLIAGALHYFELRLSSLLSELATKPKHLLLNKLPLFDGPEFVTLTHYSGGGIVPYRVFNESTFVLSVLGQGYELIDAWENPEISMYIPFHPEKTFVCFKGLYFRRKQ